jgi:hypothetical protein
MSTIVAYLATASSDLQASAGLTTASHVSVVRVFEGLPDDLEERTVWEPRERCDSDIEGNVTKTR